jgi:hypothetical protein
MDGAESNVAGMLVHVTNLNAFGSGFHRFLNVVFHSATAGLVFGENQEDLNCDNTYAERIGLFYLDKGVVFKNTQSLPHTFVDVKAGACTTAVFYVEEGGNIAIYGGCDTNSTAFMEIAQGGCNTQPILISAVRLEDTGANTSPVLLKGSATGGQQVNLESCGVLTGSPSNPQYAIDIGQGMFVVARGCTFQGKIAKLRSASASCPAGLIVDGCSVPPPSTGTWSNLLDLDTTEYCQVKVQNCPNAPYNALTWPESSPEPVVVWSDVEDVRGGKTLSVDVYGEGPDGKDAMFVCTEVGCVLLTDVNPLEIGPPQVSWGWPGDNDGFKSSVLLGAQYAINSYRANEGGSNATPFARTDSVTATVACVAADAPVYLRVFWKGYLITKP